MIATSDFLTSLECTKFVFGRSPLGELTALPRPPSWLWGPILLRGGEGKGKEMTKERKTGRGKRRAVDEREGEGEEFLHIPVIKYDIIAQSLF